MFYYLATFILVFYLPIATLAIECLQCDQKLNLHSDVLDITKSNCTKTNQVGDMCLATLFIDFQNKSASVSLGHLPDQSLTFSNGKKIMISTTTIWLSKDITLQSIQSMGMDSAATTEDINKAYNTMKTLEHEELRTKLREHLYSPLSYVHDLTCSDNEGETISCPNGFCQWAGNSTFIIDRRCISQGNGANPSGIIITSNREGESNATETIIYACTKAMCNGADANKKVRELLIDYGLLGTKGPPQQKSTTTTSQPKSTTITSQSNPATPTTPSNSTTTTSQSNSTATKPQPSATTAKPQPSATATKTQPNSTTTTLQSNSATPTPHQTIMNFQWVLLLIMTSLFKIF